jgi:hypothetical protein
MTMRSPLLLLAAVAATTTLPAQAALESYGTYDLFPGSGPIDKTKWAAFERVRIVTGGALNLVQRDHGASGGDTGVLAQSWGDDLSAPGKITQLKATVKVNAFETTGCAANPSAGFVRARLLSTFFNTGNPIPGSFIGDVLVQARIGRFSNSQDAEGVLRVQGTAGVCTDANCQSTVALASNVDLGTVTVGQPVVLAIEWRKATKELVFNRDNGATVGAMVYTVSDAAGPGRPLQSIGNRIDVPNCLSGPRTTGLMNASFDGVQINKAAKP